MTTQSPNRSKIRFGKHTLNIPGTKRQRTVLGVLLCIGGVLGFLPILGLWMLPLGILILSAEYHVIRRFRRRVEVWYGKLQRRWFRHKARKHQESKKKGGKDNR